MLQLSLLKPLGTRNFSGIRSRRLEGRELVMKYVAPRSVSYLPVASKGLTVLMALHS